MSHINPNQTNLIKGIYQPTNKNIYKKQREKQHQEPLNIPAPTRDGFHAFCSGADAHCA